MRYLEAAITLAVKAHAGQTDKAGRPYILHPLRVMTSMTTDEERATAVLHDVLEDTSVTAADLLDAGMPGEVVDAVVAVTKVKPCVYDDYLEQVKSNPIARAVKLADLADNMDMSRLPKVTETDRQRQRKYQRAWWFLMAANLRLMKL